MRRQPRSCLGRASLSLRASEWVSEERVWRDESTLLRRVSTISLSPRRSHIHQQLYYSCTTLLYILHIVFLAGAKRAVSALPRTSRQTCWHYWASKAIDVIYLKFCSYRHNSIINMLSSRPYIKSNNLILASPQSGTSGEFLRSEALLWLCASQPPLCAPVSWSEQATVQP